MGKKEQGFVFLEQEFKTDVINGLSSQEASRRLQSQGSNSIHAIKVPSLFSLFIDQLRSPLMFFLLVAGIVIYFVDEIFDACMTLAIVFFNAFLGAYQEFKIVRVKHSIAQAKIADVWVIRDGKRQIISVVNLVSGDILFVSNGEKVPVDGYVVESYDCMIDESMVTGESVPVAKHRMPDNATSFQESSFIQASSFVTTGYVKMVASATGPRTSIGKAHTFVQTLQDAPILEDQLEPLLRAIFMVIIVVCLLFIVMGLLLHKPFGQLFSTVIAFFMCVVPHGLPVIMTLVLASVAYAMKKKGLLIKRLQALLTIGRINCIVFDKTGTVTLNQQTIVRVFVDSKTYTVTGVGYNVEGKVFDKQQEVTYERASENMRMIAEAGVLFDYAKIIEDQETGHAYVKGDPFLAALTIFTDKLKCEKATIAQEYKEVYAIPQLEECGYRVSFFKSGDDIVVFVVGKASNVMVKSEHVPLEDYAPLDEMTNEGLRVSAVATKRIPYSVIQERLKNVSVKEQSLVWKSFAIGGLSYHGMVATADPVRREARAVIEQFKNLDISVVMATGDVAEIAQAVAAQVGIFTSGNKTAQGVLLLTDAQQDYRITSVWSRMTPLDKVTLVERLQKQGFIVGMVGDGANDAPALKIAHVGVVMGKGGSESAKIAAPMILTNDNLSVIADAILEARHCMDACKRIMIYFFTTNCAEMIIIFTAFFSQSELSLLAPHILWLNVISDGFLDTALAFEPYDKKKPQQIVEVMHRSVIWFVLYQALLIAGLSFCVFMYYKSHDSLEKARTMALVMISLCQWAVAINCRSLTESFFKRGFFSNRVLATVLVLIPLCMVLLVHVPVLRFIFKVTPLSLGQWMIPCAGALLLLLIEEVRKALVY